MIDFLDKYLGWVGMACLQFNSLPAIFQAIESGNSAPHATVILTIFGLACYLYHSIKRGDVLYTTGNLIGIVGNSILLAVII